MALFHYKHFSISRGVRVSYGNTFRGYGGKLFIELPFGLTASEFAALRAAYKSGCFIPGSCPCRRPKVPALKEVAQKAGITESNFSHALSNARRKIIAAAGMQIFGAEDDGIGLSWAPLREDMQGGQ